MKMKMTIAELLAWKSGKLEDYQKLLKRKRWLESRIRGAAERRFDAMDGMDCFDDDEHDDPMYLKWKADYEKATEQIEHYETQLNKVAEELLPYMTRQEVTE